MSGKARTRLFTIFFIVILSACESEYSKLQKSELDKGVRHDSLFKGIEFGQSRKEFFDLSWDKHKQGVFDSGTRGNYVMYRLESQDSASNIIMHFYPEFDENDIINGLDAEFSFTGWAPWNEHLKSDKLLPSLTDTLMNWYGGNKFMEVELENDQKIWVKIDGNRRLALRIKDDEIVQLKINDLLNE